MKFALLIFLSVIPLLSHGQEYTQSHLDSLEDEALLTTFNKVTHDSIIAEKIARTYLNRGRREGDTIKMARGYDRLARIFHPEKNIAVADSIIELTKDLNHITYPALGYILKSVENYKINNLKEAVDDLQIALLLSETTNNLTLILYILDSLITYKLIWGDKYEALNLQKKRHNLVFSENYKSEFNKANRVKSNIALNDQIKESTIHSFFTYTNCYLHLEDVENAGKYLHLFETEISMYNGPFKSDFVNLLQELRIEYFFLKKDYDYVISVSDKLIKRYMKSAEKRQLFDIYSYHGFSLIESKKQDKGLAFLLKADSIYDRGEVKILPYRRKLFRSLFDVYKVKGDAVLQLHYLEKVVTFDSVLKLNLESFEPELIKKLETPILLKEKEKLIDKLTEENYKFKTSNIWISSGFIIALLFLIYYFRMQVLYRRRFAILKRSNQQDDGVEVKLKDLDISIDIVEDIFNKLERFEENKDFLQSNITLYSLSKQLQTNVNYLSRVINTKKGVSFSNYLHELRLSYAFQRIQSNPTFRKFTIIAIAKESGYLSAASFSKAFYKKFGIYPSYYIQRLEKKK